MRFGSTLANSYYDQGLRKMREGRYANAVMLFDKALAIEPRGPKVLQKALEAARALESRSPSREAPRKAP